MAEEDVGQERTEAPTQRRREEARQQGRVAVSNDLYAGLLLLAAMAFLSRAAPTLAGKLVDRTRQDLLISRGTELDSVGARALMLSLFRTGIDLIGPFLAFLFLVTVVTGLLQVGFHIAPELLEVKWEKLSPTEGWGRIASRRTLIHGLIEILKVLAVGFAAWWVLSGRAGQIVALGTGDLGSSIARSWDLAVTLALYVAGVLAVIGVIDYANQRYQLEVSLRMTRQELKEDLKREEGDPQIKARIRKLQREAAQRRMLQEVPRATVVITNPDHLAVALQYEPQTMRAPRVLAKGAGFVAERILAFARQHAVPIVEHRRAARALFKSVPVDTEIPQALYYAVAEVLAYLYRMRGTAAPSMEPSDVDSAA